MSDGSLHMNPAVQPEEVKVILLSPQSQDAKFHRPRIHVYPESPDELLGKFDLWGQRQIGRLKSLGARNRARRLRKIIFATKRHETELAKLNDVELQAFALDMRRSLSGRTDLDRLKLADAGRAFALVRETSSRILGMRHHDVQLVGAWAMIRGMAAEMRTGEGKTLTATLAAATVGLMGLPVHVITVNDYLAARDAEDMMPLYAQLGLRVGTVAAGQQPAERRQIYDADIIYSSNKELAFDYLRDRMELRKRPGNLGHKIDSIASRRISQHTLRGLHFAIVDECDSVLIDEARTPLIISGEVKEERGMDETLFRKAMHAADRLREKEHYKIVQDEHRIELHDAGLDFLEDLAGDDDTAFGVAAIREHITVQALTARFLFHRDVDYILRDDKIQIVDEYTGRTMEDRTWSEGLHQLIELKEGVEITPLRTTLGRLTYQRFFRRYRYLGAMTGTATDAAAELWSVYRLAVAKIPTHKPDMRLRAKDKVYLRETRKWQAIAKRAALLHEKGVPVLLGTRSVSGSEKASAALEALGLPHQILSARQDANEAEIVANAGHKGQITVATNMAGRGTDIKLGPGVAALGGLHVLLSERHDSRRIDRQLEGRCGRQGDPGQTEAFLSLQDELISGRGAAFERRLASVVAVFSARAAGIFIRMRQRHVERLHARMRRDLLDADRNLADLLGFSGELE